MQPRHLMLAGLFLVAAAAARADRLVAPADAPPAFQAECGTCHLAFPPQLLSAADWRRVMGGLSTHYGSDASLEEPTRRALEDFLTRNAGNGRLGPPAPAGEALPRLTATAWFTRKHHEVPRADWTHERVKSPANCAACHTRAAEGSYREREIVMPSGARWDDD